MKIGLSGTASTPLPWCNKKPLWFGELWRSVWTVGEAPPNSYIEILILSVMVVGGGDFGRCWSHEMRVRISAFIQESTESALAPSTTWGHNRKACNPTRAPHPHPWPGHAIIDGEQYISVVSKLSTLWSFYSCKQGEGLICSKQKGKSWRRRPVLCVVLGEGMGVPGGGYSYFQIPSISIHLANVSMH